MQERRVREESNAHDFYTGSLKLSYIQFVKETWAWLCTISKYLQILHPYTFKICKHTQRHFNHTRTKPAQQETSYRPEKRPGTTKKLEKDQTSVVAQPCLP